MSRPSKHPKKKTTALPDNKAILRLFPKKLIDSLNQELEKKRTRKRHKEF